MADEQANRIVRAAWILGIAMVVVGGCDLDEPLPESAWGSIRLAVLLLFVIGAFYSGMHWEKHKDDDPPGWPRFDEDDEDGE